MKARPQLRPGRFAAEIFLLLTSSLALCLAACSNEIPVLVTVRGLSGEVQSLELKPTLDGVARNTIQPARPNEPFYLYLPATAKGPLLLHAVIRDREGCTAEASSQVEITPRSSTSREALEAVLQVDARRYPLCELQVQVEGNGAVLSSFDRLVCDGQKGPTTCTQRVLKGTTVTLTAQENAADSNLGSWKGDCEALAAQRCVLRMQRPASVQSSFVQRGCSPGGVCAPVSAGFVPPKYMVSSDALWTIIQEGKKQTLVTWDDGDWEQVHQWEAPAQALWASSGVAWVVSDNRILSCTLSPGSGCKVIHSITKPRALFGFGGTTKPEFWLSDRSTIYRCTRDSCKTTDVDSLKLNVEVADPRIFSIIANTTDEAIVSGRYPVADKCTYFARHCKGTMCLSTVTQKDLPCTGEDSFRFRAELNGPDLAVWASGDVFSLVRLSGTAALPISTKGKIAASMAMRSIVPSMEGPPYTWLIGDQEKALTMPGASLDKFKLFTTSGSDNLHAIWIDSTGKGWVVGDRGKLLMCDPAIPTGSCKEIQSLKEYPLNVVNGDASGNVWALSQEGLRVDCKLDYRGIPSIKVSPIEP